MDISSDVCNGFRSLSANLVKAFAILIDRKSCYQLGFLFEEVKDVVAFFTFGLKG